MNVLVTGGAGFIGSALCKRLVERGDKVTVLDSLIPQVHGSPDNQKFIIEKTLCSELLVGDVRYDNSLIRFLDEVDAIVHLAAETGTAQSSYRFEHYFDVNVQGTARLMALIWKHAKRLNKVVLASSRAVYGEGKYIGTNGKVYYPSERSRAHLSAGTFDLFDQIRGDLLPVATDESSVLSPISVYGITKHCQEQIVRSLSKQLGIASVVLRFQNVYGPGQSLVNPYTGLLTVFHTRISKGLPIEIYEDGKSIRDFIFIDDVIESIILALDCESQGSDIFNVGSGEPCSIVDLARRLMGFYDSSVPIELSGRFRVGDIRHNFADTSKIKRLLGFEPKVDLVSGLALFVRWAKSCQYAEDNYDLSVAEMTMGGALLSPDHNIAAPYSSVSQKKEAG